MGLIPLEIEEISDLLLSVARIAMASGSSSNRIENLLQKLGETFACEVEAAALPTAVWIVIRCDGQQKFELARVRSWGTNLQRITALSLLVDDLYEKKITPREAVKKLDEIRQMKAPFPGFLGVVAGGSSAAAITYFYGGNVTELLCAIPIGMLVEMIYRHGVVKEHRWVVADFISGVVAGALALLFASFVKDIDVSRLIIAGLIVRVPGLVFVNAVHEVAQKNLVSGAGRLLEAAIIGLSLAFGVGCALAVAAIVKGGTL